MRDGRRQELLDTFSRAALLKEQREDQRLARVMPGFAPMDSEPMPEEAPVPPSVGPGGDEALSDDDVINRMGVALEVLLERSTDGRESLEPAMVAEVCREGLGLAADGSQDNPD